MLLRGRGRPARCRRGVSPEEVFHPAARRIDVTAQPRNATMEFAPIEGPHGFGASVTCGSGVQLGSLSPHQVATIKHALLQHQLLVFREQRSLAPADQQRFAEHFGVNPERRAPADTWSVPASNDVRVTGSGHVEAYLGHTKLTGELQNGASQPTALEWHTDGIHGVATPPLHTQVPSCPRA